MPSCALVKAKRLKTMAPETISLAKFLSGTPEERATQIAKTRKACTSYGCFLIVDHPFPPELIAKTFEEIGLFFKLPLEKKLGKNAPTCYPAQSDAMITSPEGHAYMVKAWVNKEEQLPGREWLAFRSDEGRKYDASDSYFNCPEGREFYSPQKAHPEQQTYLTPNFKAVTNEYYDCTAKCTKILFELVAVALDLPPDFFNERSQRLPTWPVKSAHYAPQKEAPPDGVEVLKGHFDRDFLTMLTHSPDRHTYEGSSLQVVFDQDAPELEWTTVRIPPGAYMVFVGLIGGYWTNEYFRPCFHRVLNPPVSKEEHVEGKIGPMSVICFVNPDYDTVIEPLENCVEMTGGVKKYKKSWWGELYNWDSSLDIYDYTIQDPLRKRSGLFDKTQHRCALRASGGEAIPEERNTEAEV